MQVVLVTYVSIWKLRGVDMKTPTKENLDKYSLELYEALRTTTEELYKASYALNDHLEVWCKLDKEVVENNLELIAKVMGEGSNNNQENSD